MAVVVLDKAIEKLRRSSTECHLVGFLNDGIHVVDAVPVVDVIPTRSIDLMELDSGFTTQRGILDTVLTPLGLSVVGSTIDGFALRVLRRGEEVTFQKQGGEECVPTVVSENPIPKVPCGTSIVQLPYSSFSPEIVETFARDVEDGAVAVIPDTANQTYRVMKQSADTTVPCPPSLRISKDNAGKPTTWTTFSMESICFVGEPRAVIVKQLEFAVQRMLTLARSGRYGPSYHFSTYFFWPDELEFPICMVYPVKNTCEDDEDDALVWRRAVQVALGLGTQRPYLRVANSLASFSRNVKNKVQLKNVDEGLPCLNIGNNPVKRVFGDYEYYHYLQDKMDDSGWGCAYRSLQTICSWFNLQGYCCREPPSHREIQATLVSIGDKGKNFIGSKNWIGAIELGYVLDSLYKIESKVITVADGSNMVSVAREIGQHFDTQGTPIMIGGGVLAYTLLGIDYNEDTGDCAFLILDPHYTGTDDLAKIQKGKWVAWKQVGDKATAGGDLFVSGSFYNLLCPQRPKVL